MIYNVYCKGGDSMKVAISKWGNSIGIRIPVVIADTLGLRAGDQVACELKDDGLFMRKQQSTAQMFEQFYGKSFSEITQEDIGTAEEIDWGEDVGGEII
jgi:antitoxin MazE